MELLKFSLLQLYSSLSRVGIDKNTPEELRKYIMLANSLNLTTITLIVPYSVLFYVLGIQKLALLLGSFFFLFLFYHYLTFKKHYKVSRMLMIASLNIILGVYAIVLGRESGIHFLYFVFFTLPFLLFPVKHKWLIAVCCLASFSGFCLVRFDVIKPVVVLSETAYAIISGTMVLVTFGWLLLNKLYLIRANNAFEEMLKENNRLLQSRNQDLEQFAYVASHDLQEPLRTVASYVELLNRKYEPSFDAPGRDYMRFIVESTHRLKKLIQDLLEYSRIGRHHQTRQLNTAEVVKHVLQGLQQLVNETGAVVETGGLPEIEASSTDMQLLFQNLIANAIKFRKPGEVPRVKIEAEEKDTFWKFYVTDNGIGIDKVYHDRIFIIFQRLHLQREYEGTGIGLAHCKKIVELHGGTIWLESESGKGTTFYFTIPK